MLSLRIHPSSNAQASGDPFLTSRRKFLFQCSALAAVAVAPAGLSAAFSIGHREVALDQIEFGTFSRLVGTSFAVCHGPRMVSLELAEARTSRNNVSRSSAAGVVGGEEFSLIFSAADDSRLGQDSYRFEHERIGRFVMFIAPVGRPEPVTGRQRYQAVFNRSAGNGPNAALIYG